MWCCCGDVNPSHTKEHNDVIKWKYYPRYCPSPVTGEFPWQRPVTRSCDVFFDLSLNKWLNKPSRRWWFETTSRPLWRHCNGILWCLVRNGHNVEHIIITYISKVTLYNEILVIVGNGLVPTGSKPLAEPMLTYHQWISVAFISRYQSMIRVWTLHTHV